MTSSIDVCNRSLLAVGTRSNIVSFNEGSPEANACAILYQSTFEQLARTADWNCLRQQASLTLVEAAAGTPENQNGTTLPLPPQPWLYSYLKPNDCLDVRYLQPTFLNNQTGNPPFTTVGNLGPPFYSPYLYPCPFVVAYGIDTLGNPRNVILTNVPLAQAVYTVNQPNPSIWDSLFQQAMVASLAAYLVPALQLNMAMVQMQTKLAEAAIAQARVRDGDEGTVTQNRNASWIKARWAQGAWTGDDSIIGGGYWSNMAWPG